MIMDDMKLKFPYGLNDGDGYLSVKHAKSACKTLARFHAFGWKVDTLHDGIDNGQKDQWLKIEADKRHLLHPIGSYFSFEKQYHKLPLMDTNKWYHLKTIAKVI